MSFDPQKFFIGLIDFFSILLPGALLAYLLMSAVSPVVLRDRFHNLAGAEGWATFLFASYLFGHLVFLLAAWLDDLYNWAQLYTLNTQIEMLASRGRLLPWPVRALIWLVFKSARNLAADRAGRIKQQALGALQAIVNLLKAERETIRRTLDETYRLSDTTLNMVIIRLGDILLHTADDDFLREAARMDNYNEWMQAERECRLWHWKGARP